MFVLKRRLQRQEPLQHQPPPPIPPPTQGQPCLGFVMMLVAVFLPIFHVIPVWLLSLCQARDSRMNHTDYQRTTIWPSNPTAGHIPWESRNRKRHMHPNVHCSTWFFFFLTMAGHGSNLDVHRQMSTTEVVVHIYNGMVPSFLKEHIWVSPNEADEPRAYCTVWSKSERESQILYVNAGAGNLESWYWWSLLRGSNGDADTERKDLWTWKRGKEKVGRVDRVAGKHIHSRVWLCETPWTAALQASLSVTISQSLLKLMSIELVMPSNHLILCRPLLLPPSIFPSIRVFSNESALHIRWPQYWSFSISPSNEYSLDWSPLGWTGWISLQSQESSPTPLFKSTNSSALSLLYGLTLISIIRSWLLDIWQRQTQYWKAIILP